MAAKVKMYQHSAFETSPHASLMSVVLAALLLHFKWSNDVSYLCITQEKLVRFLKWSGITYRQSSWTCTILAWKCTPLSQSQLSLSFKKGCDWLRGVHFHAKIVHVQGLWRYPLFWLPVNEYNHGEQNAANHLIGEALAGAFGRFLEVFLRTLSPEKVF